jgi:hypothetical protein
MTLGLAVPFTDPAALAAWARRADAGPYGRIGVPDRIVYDNSEPMVMPAAMAAATERIRVQPEVVLAPELAARSVRAMATTAPEIRDAVAAYRELGAHEVMLSCWSDDIAQIDRLADLLS